MHKRYLTEVVLLTKSYNLQDFKDWLHWHLDVVGFDCCHIFDNESSVDIASACSVYKDRVSYELVRGWPNQYALYNRYINNESRAWWVLPIDDDEFLYVSDAYKHNVGSFILGIHDNHSDWCKVCIGWRNLFPRVFTEDRLNKHLILNAVGWSNEASAIWQSGNQPVKTFVNMVHTYNWADLNGQHRTHNPFVVGNDMPGYTVRGEKIITCKQHTDTVGTESVILYHYQFKSNKEWVWKCANRTSPGATWFKKDYPNKYKELYDSRYTILTDMRMVSLWNG